MKSASKWLLVWAIGILCLGPFSAHAEEQAGLPDFIRGEYCIQSIGDFDHDGTDDYAASLKQPMRRIPLIAYILPGARIDPNQIDLQQIATNPDVIILRGTQAAPFMCVQGPETRIQRHLRAMAQVAPKLAAASAVGQPTSYEFVNMDGLAPQGYTIPEAINAQGHVAGTFWVQGGQDRAFLYNGTTIQDLGTLGGDFSQALDLNNFDDVVGFSGTGATDEYGFVMSACIYDGFPMESLGTGDSWANGINDRNQIVGGLRNESKAVRAFVKSTGNYVDIGSLGGENSEANAINSTGAIVGASRIPSEKGHWFHAFLYRNGAMRDLGALGGMCWVSDDEGSQTCFEESIATDINKAGQITGFSSTENSSAHAFLYANGVMQDLGTLGGQQSWANAVNNSGQVVGTSLNADENYAPFIYEQGVMRNLTDLIVNPESLPFQPMVAGDINDFGQIVGAHFVLNPIYAKINPDEAYQLTETLGSHLSLEFWVAPPVSSGSPQNASLRLQVQFQVPAKPNSRFVNRWLSFSKAVAKGKWGNQWQKATIAMPADLSGQSATISIRASYFREKPVIYMRRLTLQ